MKYMILLYGAQVDYDALAGKAAPGRPAWSGEDFAAMGTFMASFTRELTQSGELVETRGLTAPVHARRIQLQAGVPVVTDGRTPKPRRSWRATGSWSAPASTGPPRSPPG